MPKKEWTKDEISPTHDWNEEDTLEGVYVSKEEGVGDNQSNVYTLKKENGDKVSFWGNFVLDARLKHRELGDELKIVFIGKATGKSGREYYNFETYHIAKNKEE